MAYIAKDVSGNIITNYTLMKNGLMLNSDGYLSTSNPYITVRLVQDPNSTKGLIEVKATSSTIITDTPVTITAMTWASTTSKVTIMVKNQP